MGARGVISEDFKKKVKVTFYLPRWVSRKLKYVGNQSVFVENAIVNDSGWTRPGPNAKKEEE